MASKVEICNFALSRLGQARITSLTDNVEAAKLCLAFYDSIAEEVMTAGPFSSTITRAALAQTANTPVFKYTYEYQLPTNPKCLRVLGVDETSPGTVRFKIEKDKLLTDESSVKIRYIGLIENTQLYDAMLKQAITHRLTAELAYPLTGSARLVQYHQALYDKALTMNRTIDGMQGSGEAVVSDDLLDIR